MASQLPALVRGMGTLPALNKTSDNNPLLQTLRRTNPTGAGRVFDILDTATGAKGIRQRLTGMRNPDGYDLLKYAGMTTGNKLIDVPLGIAAEIATDPSTYYTGGFSAVGRVGRAARAANLLDDVPRLYSRMAIKTGKVDDLIKPTNRFFGLDRVGRRADKMYDKLNMPLETLTDADLAVRPLIGRREAARRILPGMNRRMNLGDLVNAAPDPVKALDDVTDFLGNKNVQETLQSPIYKDFGFSLPNPIGRNPLLEFGFNVPGGQALAQGLDRIGDAARFSPVARLGSKITDRSVLNQYSDTGQFVAKRLTNREALEATKATGRVRDLIRSVDDDLINLVRNSDDAGRYLRAAVEGNERYLDDLLKGSQDIKLLKSHRQFDTLVQNTKKLFKDYLDESREVGIKSDELADDFGNGYFARNLDRRLYPDAARAGVIKSNSASVITGDMQQRGVEFNIPGGTAMLNELTRDLASDPSLRNADNLSSHIMNKVRRAQNILGPAPAKNVREVTEIKDAVGNTVFDSAGNPKMQTTYKQVSPEYTEGSAKELAEKMLAMDEQALKEGRTLFGQNPFENIERYAQGRSRAIGRAAELQSMLAQSASTTGNGTSIPRALSELGLQTRSVIPMKNEVVGAKKNVMDSINSLVGQGVITDIKELGNYYADRELQERIRNISVFYEDNRVQNDFMKFIGAITKNFKVWVLATPRRVNRDWYSGAFSNYITHPNASDQLKGYGIAKRAIIEQDWEGARSMLEKIPRYQRIKAAGGDVIKAAQDDLALVDMAQTGRLRDIDPSGNLLGEVDQTFSKYLGGHGKDSAETTLGYRIWDNTVGRLRGTRNPNVSVKDSAASELFRNPGRLTDELTPFENMRRGDFRPRSNFNEVKNPILRAAARTAETTDKINRMGGFYAMLQGGYSPEAAAKAITEAQIDYGSLTTLERNYLAVLFPFWSYQSRIVKWGAKQLANKTTFKNVGLRTPIRFGESYQDDDSVPPSRIAERYGLPVPDAFLQGVLNAMPESLRKYAEPIMKPVPGVDVWLSDIDIAFIDSLNTIVPVESPESSFGKARSSLDSILPTNFFMLPFGGIARPSDTKLDPIKTLSATSQQAAGSMLNPMAKFVVEQLSGQDLFTKTPLDATRRSLATLAGRAGAADAGLQETIGSFEPLLTSVMPALNHPLSIARKISSPKGASVAGNAAEALLNIGSGLKIERIGPEENIRDMRSKIARYLEQSPYAREMTIPYIPQEQLPYASEDLVQLYELDKILQKQQRTLRDQRVNPLMP